MALLPRCAQTLTVALALAVTASSQEAPPDDGRSSEADYVIHARVTDAEPSELDDGLAKELTGSLSLTWRNRSGEDVSDLWFHLYLNAYANNHSLHLTESKGKLRGHKLESGYGWQEITSIKIGETDLTDTLTFRVPRIEAPFDRTLFSIDLPEPVPSGGEVTVEIEWQSRLPRVRRRTGTKGNFIILSHWFPKLAVYERERGWRAHPFHMNTEFYADYGTFDVTLDLPEEYAGKVAASGKEIGEGQTADGRYVSHWIAPAPEDQEYADPVAARGSQRPTRVHGFTWTADPDYVVFEKPFRWDEWATRYELDVSETMRALDRGAADIRGREVLVRVMVQPEHAGQAERHWRATCATLFFYGLWYGPYPYSELTAVDPAWGARGAGGMEYPTLFTCGTRMFTRPEMHSPEGVTIHEAGHQFWYGLVGNNEPEAAWLDEGFNSFTDSETLFREYGLSRASTSYSRLPVWGKQPIPAPSSGSLAGQLSLQRVKFPNPIRFGLDRLDVKVDKGYRWLVPKTINVRPMVASPFVQLWRDQPLLTAVEQTTDPRWQDRSGYLRDPDSDPIETKVWDYVDSRSYSTNSYARTAVALRSLQALVGREAFLRGMRHFAEEWRYRHPYPEDFYLAFQVGADADLQWYFDDVFRDTKTVDWRCEVKQTREPKKEGWFRCDDGSWTAECGPDEPLPTGDEEASNGDSDDDSEEADGDDDSDDDSDEEDSGDEPAIKKPWVPDVLIRRRGELILPVKIRLTYESGVVRDFDWTRELQFEKTWWRLPLLPGDDRIASVVIDPERLWFLDKNMTDNQWFAKKDALAGSRWGERASTRAINLLQWFMAVGG